MAETNLRSSERAARASALVRARPRASTEVWLMRLLVCALAAALLIAVALPLAQIVARSVQDHAGAFVGLANYRAYFGTPALAVSLRNSLLVATLAALIAVPLAFVVAYGLTRTQMPGKGALRALALLPNSCPPLAVAIALIYLFGNKGLVTNGLFGALPRVDIGLYGPVGIVLAEVIACFPLALLILSVALAHGDARLYEAAAALRASPLRRFLTVTLPGARYGLVSAAFVCFTVAFTDFGAPKVVGGNFPVLATDIYKQVIGQQNFAMGATISVVLLAPTVLAFVLDRVAQRRQVALLSARAVPLAPAPNPPLDAALFAACALVALAVLALLGTALAASLVSVWPYNLAPTLAHYRFGGVGGGGMGAYWNSLRVAALTAVVGTAVVFGGAYLVEKGRGLRALRGLIALLALLPVALPGMVLGLAYIFFFNTPGWQVGGVNVPNPLHAIYGTVAILVLANVVHFYTVSHVAATAALRQLDGEIEAAASALRVPFPRTFWRVTLPVCLPAIMEIAVYFFANALVTVSAVIFLYGPQLHLASVAVVSMDDAGDTASAAAMAMLIVGTSAAARLLATLATRGLRRRSQAWAKR